MKAAALYFKLFPAAVTLTPGFSHDSYHIDLLCVQMKSTFLCKYFSMASINNVS